MTLWDKYGTWVTDWRSLLKMNSYSVFLLLYMKCSSYMYAIFTMNLSCFNIVFKISAYFDQISKQYRK